MDRPSTGILIVIDGIDGAGKTTQAKLLADFLTKAGDAPVCSKEPTDGAWGQKIRASALHGRMAPDEELQAFIEDRKEHLQKVILPALAADKSVILDRYYYSTIAYQGPRIPDAEHLARSVMASAVEPDVVVLLDVLPEVGIARISQFRGDIPNTFEGLDDLRQVRARFQEIARTHRLTVIDGTPAVDVVHQAIVSHLISTILRSKRCAKPLADDANFASERFTDVQRWEMFRDVSQKR